MHVCCTVVQIIETVQHVLPDKLATAVSSRTLAAINEDAELTEQASCLVCANGTGVHTAIRY
jgi:hypothetical protein